MRSSPSLMSYDRRSMKVYVSVPGLRTRALNRLAATTDYAVLCIA